MSESAILLRAVGKQYGTSMAVQDLTWEVPSGSVAGILGPNGAGKSTTLSMLVGLVRPSAGRTEVLGMDPQRDATSILAQTGYVPEGDALYPWMTVADALRFCEGFSTRWSEKWVSRCLEAFSLGRHEKVSKMSKGMRRQLQITLALATRPQLLILDEPTSGLDPENRHALFGLLVDAVAEEGATVLLSTHQLYEVERFADVVMILRQGKVVASGPLDKLKMDNREIRIVFQDDAPDLASWPAVVATWQEGKVHVVKVNGAVDDFLGRLAEFRPLTVDVVERNLEEVYLHSAGEGERRHASDPSSHS